ncbi:Hypothetical predicted protein [Paramuricea clavata]|uniref:Uncharacterized protein n=1 Tax=Paramuricea clavata TaxID=317549 RepID=A0A7D9H949_PARCT|nr:Hypothetical predicted protein [Paramuricea clavata]
MYLKSFSTNIVLTAILFIMIHVNKSVARMERGSSNLRKFLKYDEEKISWLRQKRTHAYRDPCEKDENVVNTGSLDTDSCSTCMYFPSTLKEVKCSTGNGLNVRGKTSCNYNIDGDCINIEATISVIKVYSNGQHVQRDVHLKVGCACMLLPV